MLGTHWEALLTEPVDKPGAVAPLELDKLPKAALQAIYHAVTGKTESLSRDLEGNVICTTVDIDRLYEMIADQLNMYPKEVTPTTTIVVKAANDQAITYSSWERYKALRVENHEITSDFTIKIEAIFRLPNTPAAQRCVINLVIDSSLPVIAKQREDAQELDALGFFLMIRPEWKTLSVKIDFVDFLLAKAVIRTAEEWFGTLRKTPTKWLNTFIRDRISGVQRTVDQIPRIGFAAYLASIAFMANFRSINQILYAFALGLLLWSLLSVYSESLSKTVFRRTLNNVIPTVILLTDGDIAAYDKIETETNEPTWTLVSIIGSIALAVIINIVASYIFRYLTT
jgi:hypothetical protein